MIIARLFPKNTKRYLSAKKSINSYEQIIKKHNVVHLFSVWTITLSGMAFYDGQLNRFAYWDWSGWSLGIFKLVFSSIIFFMFTSFGFVFIGNGRINVIDMLKYFIICTIYFFVGAFGSEIILISFLGVIPYLIVFGGSILMYQLKVIYFPKNDTWDVDNWQNKNRYFLIAMISFIISAYLGYHMDDPIISTVSMISLFFPAVTLLWPNHVRHIKRAQFFPLFILAMFTCVRLPWFLVPLLILFFLIRSINYLKYGIVYPSFGVLYDETVKNQINDKFNNLNEDNV